jgi:hypothetical protein
MRNVIAFVTFLVLVCGCRDQRSEPRLEPLARGISEALQQQNGDFRLEIRAESNGNRVTLHCVLRNVSMPETALDVDASTLPWLNSDLFNINAVAADGKVVHRNPWPVVLARISGPPTPVSIASGKSMEGDMDLGAMPISALPRNEDLILLWSYSVRQGHSDNYYMFSGATFLKATS